MASDLCPAELWQAHIIPACSPVTVVVLAAVSSELRGWARIALRAKWATERQLALERRRKQTEAEKDRQDEDDDDDYKRVVRLVYTPNKGADWERVLDKHMDPLIRIRVRNDMQLQFARSWTLDLATHLTPALLEWFHLPTVRAAFREDVNAARVGLIRCLREGLREGLRRSRHDKNNGLVLIKTLHDADALPDIWLSHRRTADDDRRKLLFYQLVLGDLAVLPVLTHLYATAAAQPDDDLSHAFILAATLSDDLAFLQATLEAMGEPMAAFRKWNQTALECMLRSTNVEMRQLAMSCADWRDRHWIYFLFDANHEDDGILLLGLDEEEMARLVDPLLALTAFVKWMSRQPSHQDADHVERLLMFLQRARMLTATTFFDYLLPLLQREVGRDGKAATCRCLVHVTGRLLARPPFNYVFPPLDMTATREVKERAMRLYRRAGWLPDHRNAVEDDVHDRRPRRMVARSRQYIQEEETEEEEEADGPV